MDELHVTLNVRRDDRPTGFRDPLLELSACLMRDVYQIVVPPYTSFLPQGCSS